MVMSQKAKVRSTIQRFSNGDNDRNRSAREVNQSAKRFCFHGSRLFPRVDWLLEKPRGGESIKGNE